MSAKKSFSDLINSETPVLADFYADWCGPCKMLAPALEQFSSENHSRVRVVKIDVDKNPSAANHFQIRGVPTLILFKKGKVLWRKSGMIDMHALNKEVSNYL